MKKIKTIIVDDEIWGINVLEILSARTPQIEILETFENPIEALAYFESNDVDLIFLDVQMPQMNGIEFLNRLNGRAKVIMTSADDPNRLIGFDINSVLDYLRKPIGIDMFLKAIDHFET